MTDETFDDIRKLLDPDAYRRQLEQGKAVVKEQLTGLFVDLDLIRENPEIDPEIKEAQVAVLEKQVRDWKWRYDEIERKVAGIDEMKSALVGVNADK